MLLKILWDQNICFLCLTPLLTSFFSYLQSKLQCNDDSISGTVYLKFIIVENFPQDTLFDIVIILVSVFFQYGQKKIIENQNVWRISIIFIQGFPWEIESCFTDKGKSNAALELYQSFCRFLVRLSNFAIFTGHLHNQWLVTQVFAHIFSPDSLIC